MLRFQESEKSDVQEATDSGEFRTISSLRNQSPSLHVHVSSRLSSGVSYQDAVHVQLAGPMRQQDELHVASLLLSLLILILTLAAFIIPSVGYVIDGKRQEDGETSHCYFSILKVTREKSVSCDLGKSFNGDKLDVTMDTTFSHALHLMPIFGLAFSILGLLIQIVNFVNGFSQRRNLRLHKSVEFIYFLTGIYLFLAGHMSHTEAVWGMKGPLKASPIFSGLIFMAVLLCAWVGVLVHVGCRAPGPLSENTRFMHIYDAVLKDSLAPTTRPVVLEEEDGHFSPPVSGPASSIVSRKKSKDSTEV